jgi:hypothetical protein
MIRTTSLALVGACLLASSSSAQLARAILREGDAPSGAPAGHVVTVMTTPNVNHATGFGVGFSTSNGTVTLSHFWGSATGAGAPAILRTESTINNFEQTSFESFWGYSDAGEICYSPLGTNHNTGGTGLDAAWLDDLVLAEEGQPIVSMPGKEWRFASRPSVSGDGIPVWVGGIDDAVSGADEGRGLFRDVGATVLLKTGDVLANTGGPIDNAGISFDYRFSRLATHYIAEIDTTELTAVDAYMVLDGAVMTAGGPADFIHEGSPVPLSIGGLAGENWANFDFTAVTESGEWFLTGDTSGVTTSDEFVMKNGQILYREGDMLDGLPLTGSIDAAYMNEAGRITFLWDVVTPAGTREAIFIGDELIVMQGDAVDLDGDGVVEPTSILVNPSDVTIASDDTVYFVGTVDVNGTSSTTDDIEALLRVECMPVPYGIGKLNSLSMRSDMSFSGMPSLAANDFVLQISGLTPLNEGMAFYGFAEDQSPLFNHFLYVAPPIQRILPPVVSSATGEVSIAIPIDISMVGTTRYFQFWGRDPAAPDGTGSELSSALKVTFCP